MSEWKAKSTFCRKSWASCWECRFPDPGLCLILWLSINSSLLFQLNEVLGARPGQIVKRWHLYQLVLSLPFLGCTIVVCALQGTGRYSTQFPGPGKAFWKNLSAKGLYQPSRSWLGFLLTYKTCSMFVFKRFSLRSTMICLFLRHRAFSHCLLIQSDSSVDSARFCSCTPCL